jgi:excinuclease UvrABC ATPase subunit
MPFWLRECAGILKGSTVRPSTTIGFPHGGHTTAVKAAEARRAENLLFILDEPTTGLSFHDVAALLNVLQRLVEGGNTVVIIEHQMDVIKNADYIVDLGPGAGDKGGYIVATGSWRRFHRNAVGRMCRSLLGSAAGRWNGSRPAILSSHATPCSFSATM